MFSALCSVPCSVLCSALCSALQRAVPSAGPCREEGRDRACGVFGCVVSFCKMYLCLTVCSNLYCSLFRVLALCQPLFGSLERQVGLEVLSPLSFSSSLALFTPPALHSSLHRSHHCARRLYHPMFYIASTTYQPLYLQMLPCALQMPALCPNRCAPIGVCVTSFNLLATRPI